MFEHKIVPDSEEEKIKGEKPVLRNVRDVLEFITTEQDEPKPEFAAAMAYLKDQIHSQLGWTAEPTNYEVAQAICDKDSGANVLKRTIDWLTDTVMEPAEKQTIYIQLIKLVELSKNVVVFSQALELAQVFPTQDTLGYASAKDAVENMPGISSQTYDNEGPKKQDSIKIFYPNIPGIEDKTQAAMKRFLVVWNTIRCTDEPRICRILFTHSDNQKVRSRAEMDMNPDVVIELAEVDYVTVAGHEAVHAAFGEAGMPMSKDMVEGCATRLGYAFNREADRNLPSEMTLNYIKSQIAQDRSIRSSTKILRENSLSDEYLIDNLGYAYGFFLVDTLLKNSTYRKLAEKKATESGRPYALLMQLNREMATYVDPKDKAKIGSKGKILSRNVLVYGLLKVGFSQVEVQALLNNVNTAIELA